MTYEVDLVSTRDGEHLLYLLEQLFTAQFRAVGSRDLRDIDAGTVPGQGLRDTVEVIYPEQLVEAEQSMHQHHGVTGLGITCRLTQHGQGAQQHQ